MTSKSAASPAAAPWHLWLIGVLSLIWNGYGGYLYFMIKTGGDAFMHGAGMNEAEILHYNEMPTWMSADWAVGVWFAVLGSVLLLLRSRWATPAFLVSLVGIAGMWIYNYGVTCDGEMMGERGLSLNVAITVAAVAFVLYAWAMAKRDALR